MSDLPEKLSEMDRLRLQLSKERQGRIQAQAQALAMARAQHEAQLKAAQAEDADLFATLKKDYQLEQHDELGMDGSIKRASVRAIKEA